MTTAAPGGDELRTALADGFALQVERWARASGAPGDAARLAGRAARALSLAIGDGHVCVPLHELGELGDATGRFGDKVAGYAQRVEAADSLDSLAEMVREMVGESRTAFCRMACAAAYSACAVWVFASQS